jgi:REP element-mobilizing transposase RayT
MTQFTPRKSSPRLDGFAYRGRYAYFVTGNTAGRERALRGDFAQACVAILEESAAARGFDLLAYCLMPDHFHLLAQGVVPDADLVRFVQLFKQKTGYRYKQETRRQLWRRSYYDHVLRDEDAIEDIAAYIWHNPVRAGLAEDAASYQFSGPPVRFAALSPDRAEALSVRLGPLFESSAVCA